MEEKIKELEHKVDILSGVVFILLKETGMLDKAMEDSSLLRAIVSKAERKEVQDKSMSKQEEDKFTSILKDFDAKDAIKN